MYLSRNLLHCYTSLIFSFLAGIANIKNHTLTVVLVLVLVVLLLHVQQGSAMLWLNLESKGLPRRLMAVVYVCIVLVHPS